MPAILFAEQTRPLPGLLPPEAPGNPRLAVQVFRERLRQSIGQRFRQDRVVIVVVGRETSRQLIRADSRRDGETAEIIAPTGAFRCDKIGQTMVGLSRPVSSSAAAENESVRDLGARFVAINLDIVADRIGGPESVNTAGGQQLLVDDPARAVSAHPRTARAPAGRPPDRRRSPDNGRAIPRCGKTATNRCSRPKSRAKSRLRLTGEFASSGERTRLACWSRRSAETNSLA